MAVLQITPRPHPYQASTPPFAVSPIHLWLFMLHKYFNFMYLFCFSYLFSLVDRLSYLIMLCFCSTSIFHVCDVCMCVHMIFPLCEHTHMWVCASACGGPSLMLGMILHCFSTLFRSLNQTQSSPKWLVLLGSLLWDPPSPLSEAGITGRLSCLPGIYVSFWRPRL